MIQSKKDLCEYLLQDQKALGNSEKKKPRLFQDDIWSFQIALRKTEYYKNNKAGYYHKILYLFFRMILKQKSMKLGFTIPLNVFGPGLSIAHYGPIVVNSNAKIGSFCRIQTSVTIGATNGSHLAPQIGDYVYLGDGCKIIGDINIADGICIGANAVVVKSFHEPNITIAGIPARKISNNSSKSNLMVKENKG